MSATVQRHNASSATTEQEVPLLRCGISVTASHGRLTATVELHGDLGPAAAPQLHAELQRLIDDGIGDITVDAGDLRLCTSHGLDVFDDIQRLLRERHDGTLRIRLDGARAVVRRTVRLVQEHDPTFSPIISDAPR